MTRIKQLPYAALLLAIALTAGCNKSKQNAENPPAGTPAASQPSGDQSAQPPAQSSAPAASGQPSAQGSSAAPPPPPAASQGSAAAPAQSASAAPPPPSAAGQEAPAPAPLPVVPAGTTLSVRMSQTIDVKHAQSGQPFSGTVVNPVVVDSNTVVPSGSTAEGVVVRAHKRGHFKGSSILQLTLTGLNINGQHYRIESSSITRTKKGKGKRSLGFIGGGTGLGMLIGGVATGGVGLLVGGLAGAGAGTGVAGLTGNKDITIPAESVVTFRLADSIHLR